MSTWFDLTDAATAIQSSTLEGLEELERYLREQQRTLAADELFKLRLELDTARRHIAIMTERLHDVIYAAEKASKGDTGIGAVDAAVNELVKGKAQ